MVFTAMHYIPSAISALLVIFLATRVRPHRGLALAMALFALLGLAGYLYAGEILRLFSGNKIPRMDFPV